MPRSGDDAEASPTSRSSDLATPPISTAKRHRDINAGEKAACLALRCVKIVSISNDLRDRVIDGIRVRPEHQPKLTPRH